METQIKETCQKIIESWNPMADVPVGLSIELGRTTLRLREILKLDLDSIVKLPRSTGEGVDVRADGRSLFRGEIVVIEDRAAVRINEIVAR